MRQQNEPTHRDPKLRMNAYFELMNNYPRLFHNPEEKGVLRIITDPSRIQTEVEKIGERLRQEGNPASWIDLGVLVDDPWFLVLRDLVEFPDGKVGGYIRFINRKSLEDGPGVVVIPRIGGNLILIRHFRHEDRKWHWEFPRGFGQAGLSAHENAAVELREELHLDAREFIDVYVEDSNGHYELACFIAEISSTESLTTDPSEGIQTHQLMPVGEFEALVMQGQITDPFTIKAFFVARIKNLL